MEELEENITVQKSAYARLGLEKSMNTPETAGGPGGRDRTLAVKMVLEKECQPSHPSS